VLIVVDGHEDIYKVMGLARLGISSVNISLSVAVRGVQGLRVNRTSGLGGKF
jgi:hypothetical protein